MNKYPYFKERIHETLCNVFGEENAKRIKIVHAEGMVSLLVSLFTENFSLKPFLFRRSLYFLFKLYIILFSLVCRWQRSRSSAGGYAGESGLAFGVGRKRCLKHDNFIFRRLI